MRSGDDPIAQLRDPGFVLLPAFFSPDEIDAAREGLWEEYPRPEQYFADPSAYPQYSTDQFAGLRQFPYHAHALNRLAFHPRLVELAERFLGSPDLELYQIDLWAKYAGAIDYDQPLHRDYGWRSLVVPRADGWRPQISVFILLSDVTADDGPTRIVAWPRDPNGSLADLSVERDDLAEAEISMAGPAGTVLIFRTDVLHRGSNLVGPGRSRFVLIAGYQERGLPWAGGATWSEHGQRPRFREVLEQATPRERALFGFPPVGHEYWNEQTLRDVAARYPAMDMTPYREGVAAR